MKTLYHAAGTRGHRDHGWLDTHHTFSFANYYDRDRMGFGALRVINDDRIESGAGFGMHPHDNMEIVTVMLAGMVEHRDSAGHRGVIRPGDVQTMSAGTGVFHSEMTVPGEPDVELLQIWVLPRERGGQPRYRQARIPESSSGSFTLLVSPDTATDDPNAATIRQDAWFTLATPRTGENPRYDLHRPETNVIYAFVIEGSATVAGTSLSRRDGLGISETEGFMIENASPDAKILLMEIPNT